MSITPETEDKIDIIRQQVYHIDEAMRPPPEKCAALLRELNDMQASTRVLPPEILSTIFGHVCRFVWYAPPCSDEKPRIYPELALGHVSSHWRQVAGSTPEIWGYMTITLSGSNAHGIPSILDLHFRNVGSYSLMLHLKLPHETTPPNVADAICSIGALLFDDKNAGKVASLAFSSHIPLKWQHSFSSHLSKLVYFRAEGGPNGESDHDIFLQDVPHLRYFVMECCRVNVSLPSSSVTEIYLTSVPIDVCFKVLTHCPNLTGFQCTRPDDALENTTISSMPVSSATLHHLQEFQWEYHESAWCLAIQHVQLPTLRELSWSQRGSLVGGAEPAVRALFSNLADTLRTLELQCIRSDWTVPLIRRTFSHCRYVQMLNMMYCNRSTMYEVLCTLCPGWEGDETRYLPALRSLMIYSHDEDEDGDEDYPVLLLDHDFSRRILGICKAKFTGGVGEQFELRFRDIEVDWAPGVLEELGGMVEDGFKLRIRDAKGDVKWQKRERVGNVGE